MKQGIRIILIAAILLVVNLLAKQFFFRLDITEDKSYTLSKATKSILKNLDEPVTITGYFTKDLPQTLAKAEADFKDLLIEYSNRSKGMVNYEIIDPKNDPEREQEALSNGIPQVSVNVREKDEVAVKKAFMGALIKVGELQEAIPIIQPGNPIEYELTTAIKKLTVADKPSIGLIQGFGTPSIEELQLFYQSLSILYQVEPIELEGMDEIPARFKALVMVRPTDSIPQQHFYKLDNYLNNGGSLCIALNTVEGDFQTVQGNALATGTAEWLAQRGVDIPTGMIIDASCGSISVQQRQGFFTMNTQVEFPYFPRVNQFLDHPITKGIEQIIFQFASPISFRGDTSSTWTPIVQSSSNSGILNLPISFDVNKKWGQGDFPMPSQTLGGVLEQTEASGVLSRIVIFSDGDFPIGSQGRGQTPDNVSLLTNAVDWLSDDTGLIDLRTKGVISRPIKEMEDGKRTMLKWLNFLLPILLVFAYGFFRFQRNRSKRLKRMQQQIV
jgi:gliding-associated putative ABC transporter substrate-binding component GldG